MLPNSKIIIKYNLILIKPFLTLRADGRQNCFVIFSCLIQYKRLTFYFNIPGQLLTTYNDSYYINFYLLLENIFELAALAYNSNSQNFKNTKIKGKDGA